MQYWKITPENYTLLKSDINLKTKVQQVSGKAYSQKWVEENQIGVGQHIKPVIEANPRIASGYATKGDIAGRLSVFSRGENYYYQGSIILRFENPIDFNKARAQAVKTVEHYVKPPNGRELLNWYNDKTVEELGRVIVQLYKGNYLYTPQSPVMPIPAQDAPPMPTARLNLDFSDAVKSGETLDEVPRKIFGSTVSKASGSYGYGQFYDENRMINRISGSFGRTSEEYAGPGDEFFGFNKVDYNDNVIPWTSSGDNWNPNAIKVDYIVRVESRYFGIDYNPFGSSAYAERWVCSEFDIQVYATSLLYDEIPFVVGSGSDSPYSYQDSSLMDAKATYYGGMAYQRNSQSIIDAYGSGKRIVQFEFKVYSEFIQVGDLVSVQNKYGKWIGGEEEPPMKFRVISARKYCSSTFNQEIIAIEE